MADFLADTNVPIHIPRFLRKLGHDVRTMQQVEGTSRPECPMADDAVLETAITQRRAVVTLNAVDFRKLHDARRGHSGIIICRTDEDCKKRAKEIDQIAKENNSLNGQLFYVPPIVQDET